MLISSTNVFKVISMKMTPIVFDDSFTSHQFVLETADGCRFEFAAFADAPLDFVVEPTRDLYAEKAAMAAKIAPPVEPIPVGDSSFGDL